jgi:hypothetical protein
MRQRIAFRYVALLTWDHARKRIRDVDSPSDRHGYLRMMCDAVRLYRLTPPPQPNP